MTTNSNNDTAPINIKGYPHPADLNRLMNQFEAAAKEFGELPEGKFFNTNVSDTVEALNAARERLSSFAQRILMQNYALQRALSNILEDCELKPNEQMAAALKEKGVKAEDALLSHLQYAEFALGGKRMSKELKPATQPAAWMDSKMELEPISDAVKASRPDLYGKNYPIPLFAGNIIHQEKD